MPSPLLAVLFNEYAEGSLKSLGLELEKGPSKTIGSWSASTCRYQLKNGLFVSVFFMTDDGVATVSFGRNWQITPRSSSLSNRIYIFCKRYGLEVAEYYPLIEDDPEGLREVFQNILDDLHKGLPTVLSRLTLLELEEIEREQSGGAALKAEVAIEYKFTKEISVSTVNWEPV